MRHRCPATRTGSPSAPVSGCGTGGRRARPWRRCAHQQHLFPARGRTLDADGLGFGLDADQCPGVVARSFGSLGRGVGLSRGGAHGRGQVAHRDAAGAGGDLPGRGDLHDVPEPVAANLPAQSRVAAIDLVAGDPLPGTLAARARSIIARELRLGRELDVIGDAGTRAPVGSSHQDVGRYRARSTSACPGRGGVGRVDRDLRVLDPARGTDLLAVHPDRRGALLQVPGLVDHEHRARIGEVVQHVAAYVVPGPVGVPGRMRKQVLQPMRTRVTGVLGNRPAVLAPNGATSRATKSAARASGSRRENRPEIRPNADSNLPARLEDQAGISRTATESLFQHKHRTLTRWPSRVQAVSRHHSTSGSRSTAVVLE